MALADADELERPVRCPICLADALAPVGADERTKLRCPRCGKTFLLRWALPPRRQGTAQDAFGPTAALAAEDEPVPAWAYLAIACGAILTIGIASGIGRPLRGPEFLAVYAVLFVLTIAAATALRSWWRDLWVISIAAFLAFELTGVIRILDGMSRGMHRFGFLGIMMVLGGVMYFLRARADGDGFGIAGNCGVMRHSTSTPQTGSGGCSSSFVSSCSGGSSCSSGGGCGGGGCGGGCGGCGGG